jgi:hypothetical protein
MIRALVDHVGPVLVAVSLAAALISTAKWLLDLRAADATPDPDPNPVGEFPQQPDEGEAA